MALNKNALIRYRTIDRCLQNKYRTWTLKDLIDACSEALHEYEGREITVSKRTVQLDIQLMRSNKLGYDAPIEVYNKKYYRYSNEEYSITDIPLTEVDMNILSESVSMLKQFKDFSLFSELDGVIQKLEDKVYSEQNDSAAIIHMEKNDQLKGLQHLDTIYQAILKKIVLQVDYQSFKAISDKTIVFHCFILKEYNNRWFAVGKRDGEKNILTLALDRIVSLAPVLNIDYVHEGFNADEYYANTYGVTVMGESSIINIKLIVDKSNAPYVLTKPFHKSQKLMRQNDDGSIEIHLRVHHNYEIERLILGFGESIEVIGPRRLRKRIQSKLSRALENYS